MKRIVAYCGSICSDCPAYVATQAGNWAALEAIAAQWRAEYNAAELTAKDVVCDGCLGEACRRGGYCPKCKIRACALSRGIAICSECGEYPCPMIEHVFEMSAANKAVLEGA